MKKDGRIILPSFFIYTDHLNSCNFLPFEQSLDSCFLSLASLNLLVFHAVLFIIGTCLVIAAFDFAVPKIVGKS